MMYIWNPFDGTSTVWGIHTKTLEKSYRPAPELTASRRYIVVFKNSFILSATDQFMTLFSNTRIKRTSWEECDTTSNEEIWLDLKHTPRRPLARLPRWSDVDRCFASCSFHQSMIDGGAVYCLDSLLQFQHEENACGTREGSTFRFIINWQNTQQLRL